MSEIDAAMVKVLEATRDLLAKENGEMFAQVESAEARAERYRKALEELVGILEIAACMPEAIHKQMFVSWDDPALERARAALRGEG